MTYQPPFTITSEIIDLISVISERLGFVQRDFLDASPQLRKGNRIKTITGTLQIEGNTLTEDQVAAVLEGKPVLATARELAEVQGAIAAYEKLHELNPYSLEDLLNAHRLMMGGVLRQAGRFRNQAVGVYKEKQVVHVAPPAHRISGLMAELLAWAQKTDTHPLVASSVFHYEFEYIHPFLDGNGRMGRLWQTLMLAQWNPLFAEIPLENVIKLHQREYYQTLSRADSDADSTVFITFMLKAIRQTLENAPQNAPLNAPLNMERMKTPEAIMALMRADSSITRRQLAEIIGKDIRTIGRAIKKLQDEGKLRRIGSDKTGHWELL